MTGMMCKIEQIACPRNVPNSHPFLTKLLLLFGFCEGVEGELLAPENQFAH